MPLTAIFGRVCHGRVNTRSSFGEVLLWAKRIARWSLSLSSVLLGECRSWQSLTPLFRQLCANAQRNVLGDAQRDWVPLTAEWLRSNLKPPSPARFGSVP